MVPLLVPRKAKHAQARNCDLPTSYSNLLRAQKNKSTASIVQVLKEKITKCSDRNKTVFQ